MKNQLIFACCCLMLATALPGCEQAPFAIGTPGSNTSTTGITDHGKAKMSFVGDQDSDSVDIPLPARSHDASKLALSHREIVQRAEDAILYIVSRDAKGEEIASGTGFLIDEQGFAATNHHVLEEAVHAKVQTRDGIELEIAGVIGADPDHDIVIFKLDSVPDGLTPMPLMTNGQISQGDDVTAIGHPAGFQYTATNGIVSAVRTTAELPAEFRESLQAPESAVWIQTSAAISGGSSGGPLIDEFGSVIGMNTWIAQGQNLGFAIHVDHIRDVFNRSASAEASPLPLPGFGTITDPDVAMLNGDFEKEYAVFLRSKWDEDEKSTLEKIFDGSNPLSAYGEQFLELAKANPNTESAVQALVQAAKLLSRSEDIVSRGKLLTAVDLLQTQYLDSPWIGEAAISLGTSTEEKVIDLQKAIIQKSPHHDAQGIACYALASNLQRRNAYLSQYRHGTLGDSQPEYVALLKRAVDQYGDVRLRGGTLKTILGPTLDLAQISNGMQSPDIDGKNMFYANQRLKDNLGKVVVLDFWVNWCPYCRQMYPDNVKLVEKYEGQDFALLGINCDQNRSQAEQAFYKYKMNYPSWFDPKGEIASKWAVNSYPTMFVLDKRGVIRERLNTTDFKTLDKIVQRLMNEDKSTLGGNLLQRGAIWRYYSSNQAPGPTWAEADFADNNWKTGAAPLGFGLGEATTLDHAAIGVGQTMTHYFRNEFEIDDLEAAREVVIEGFFDDGIVVYVNGQEVSRCFVPVDGDHNTPAAVARRGQGRTPACFAVRKSILRQGTNTIAVEVHQASEWSADLLFDLSISTDVLSKVRSMLKSDDPDQRETGLRVATDLRAGAKSLVPLIKPMLNHDEHKVRLKAFGALLAIDAKRAAKMKAPKLKRFKEMDERKLWAMSNNDSSWEIAEVPGLGRRDYLQSYHQALISDRLHPKNGLTLNTKALALVRLGLHKRGLQTLSAARKVHGQKPADYLVACIAYHSMGKPDRAKAMYEKAVKLLDEIKRPELKVGFDSLMQQARELAQGA